MRSTIQGGFGAQIDLNMPCLCMFNRVVRRLLGNTKELISRHIVVGRDWIATREFAHRPPLLLNAYRELCKRCGQTSCIDRNGD